MESQWHYRGERINSSVYEHTELIDRIRKGQARNDALDFAAESKLAVIMSRESAYTGKLVAWAEMIYSEIDLFPKSLLGSASQRPVPIPGKLRTV